MPLPMPQLDGVEHTWHDLPTGVRIHLASAGPEDAPPVLALHGWPQHWWSWREVIARLGDFRLLCPDLRGLGWSGWPADGDFVKERLAEDAVALLDALGHDRVRLVGHDWGAWAAILAALRAPERFSSLLALSIGHPWVPRGRALRNAYRLAYQLPLAAPFAGEAVVRDGRYVRWMLERARAGAWGPGEVDAYVAATREAARASACLYRHFLARELPPALADGFRDRRLTVPARLLHGTRDPLGRELAEDFPGELELVERAGHYLPEETPDLVAERIRAMA